MKNTHPQLFKAEELVHVNVYPNDYAKWDEFSNEGESAAVRILSSFDALHAPDLDGPTTGNDRQAFNVLLLQKDLPGFELLVKHFDGYVENAGPVQAGHYGDGQWGSISIEETDTPGVLAWIE